jgi:hypothetical protein
MLAKVPFPQESSTKICTPIFVQADERIGRLQIRSLAGDDALCKKVVDFLTSHDFEFYMNGKRYTQQDAVSTVNMLRARIEGRNPFSGFPILDNGKVVGLIRIGFDDDPRKIQIAGLGLDQYQNIGNGRAALAWILKEYLPMLHSKGYRLPVYGFDGKTVKEWIDLDKTSVVATVHPDYEHCNHLLSKGGFRLVKQIKLDNYAGVHDGRRNVYEIALKQFIKPNCCGF